MTELNASAIVEVLHRHGVVRVADLADVIRSKEAAGRPKDLKVLPIFYAHLAKRSR
ncbi:MAG: hypothetical protein ACT4QG_19660 [Sporichthyaceae bacterium]